MAGAAQQKSPATDPQLNAAARAALFQSGFFSSIELPSQAWADGGSYTFNMPHAGVGLYAQLRIGGTVTWTDTNGTPVAPTLSSGAPYNLLQNIKYQDYLGNTRINAGGVGLHFREVLQYFQDTSGEAFNTTAERNYTAPIDNFKLNASSTVAQTVDFGLLIPFTFHENTTIGGLPFTVPSGNNTVYVTLNPLFNNPAVAAINFESPIQLASTGHQSTTTVTASLTLQMTYYYIDPLPSQMLPLMDFSQVYEIVDVKSTDNLSSSATKTILLPTGRTYQGLYAQIVNVGQLYDTGMSQVQFLINESTPTLNEFYISYLHRIRRTYGRDLPVGILVWDLRNRPLSPSNYGSLALQVILGSSFSASGETAFTLTKESLYVLQTQVY
jgi:hypothetical protein